MSSTAEIKAQIQAAIEQVNEAMSAIGNAQSQADGGIGAGTAATQDTSNSLPGEALGQWQQGKERLEEALGSFRSGADTFEQYMNTI